MTAKMKPSIYFRDPLKRLVEGHDNRSARLNDVAELFALIVANDCPALTELQWRAVCDALTGEYLRDASALWLAQQVGGIVRVAWHDGSGEDWGIDALALAEQLRNSTAGQRVAVAEIVDRYRRHMAKPGMTPTEALRLAGARIAPPADAATSAPQQAGD